MLAILLALVSFGRKIVRISERNQTPLRHNHPDGDASQCAFCRNNYPFELPAGLYEAVLQCRVVLFAGAGISTESDIVPVETVVQAVCSDLRIEPEKAPAFPDLMTLFCEKWGKAALLRKIKSHFENIWSFSELYGLATRFHEELGTIFHLQDIVTPNWDDYFERECGATSIVTAEDFMFWNVPGRKVVKIHGSVNSFGSIVATREDYEKCYQALSTGLVGSSLKMFLATKTILYAGFSFRDDDFVRIRELISRQMQGLHRESYVVTLDRSSDARFREMGLNPIYTEATFFLAELKKRLTADRHMLADDRFNGVRNYWVRVLRAHQKVFSMDLRKYPDSWYCLAYQDGLKHALDRIVRLRSSGYYSDFCNVRNTLMTYDKNVRPIKLRTKEYFDVAYVDGYIDGHLYLLASDDQRKVFPTYYVLGNAGPLQTYDEFQKALARAPKIHKAAHKLAERSVKAIPAGTKIGPHHPPIL